MLSSEKYELAQDELETLMEKINSSMNLIRQISHEDRRSDEKRQTAMRLRGYFDEAKKIIDEMEYEARKAPLVFRSGMLNCISTRRFEVSKLKDELRQNRFSNRMFEESIPKLPALNSDDPFRQQAMMSENSIRQTAESIARSTQIALETGAVGEEIISDLGTQRETLERSRSRLRDTEEEVKKSRRVLRKIYVGIFQNKIILIATIILQLISIVAIVYWKYLSKK